MTSCTCCTVACSIQHTLSITLISRSINRAVFVCFLFVVYFINIAWMEPLNFLRYDQNCVVGERMRETASQSLLPWCLLRVPQTSFARFNASTHHHKKHFRPFLSCSTAGLLFNKYQPTCALVQNNSTISNHINEISIKHKGNVVVGVIFHSM